MVEMVYVEVRRSKNNEGFFQFGCTGYGWVYKDTLLNPNTRCIGVRCDDNFNGERGWTAHISDIKVCKVQKPYQYNI